MQKEIVEQFVHAYNAFDVDGMLRNMDPDVVFENSQGGVVTMRLEGVDAFRAQAEQVKDFFSEREQVVEAWEFTGDSVRIEVAYMATLARSIPDGPQAGETLRLRGVSTFVLKDNKITYLKDES
ncbi:hypothetical protein A3SI_15413 [Nitritalea halalkaliphila LW7]|uniref:SnoaL-like domain-containing protein n=1 Tax=Nitritalea halalkaliphila LW7 TaxID=1189621 RepID=I5BYD4_9BACT|nr:nuclear transport factor 2 family protein [Nitritalea halalkaliphila]EIM74586.1 hypothetical protein A3SI_15413 [Nitritalea halalkaliphila LW7]